MSGEDGQLTAWPKPGRDIQRNLVAILLVTSRSWGLLPAKPGSRQLVPRLLTRQSIPLRRITRVPRVPGHGLHWAW